MTVIRYDTDTCPACGSTDVLPYSVIVGPCEEYGYQCTACLVTWPVLTSTPAVVPVPALRGPRS